MPTQAAYVLQPREDMLMPRSMTVGQRDADVVRPGVEEEP
jgi:hypothetical protein